MALFAALTAKSGLRKRFSGQVAINTEGELVGGGDFDLQVGQVIANIDAGLAALSATRNQIVKLTVFVVNLDMERHGPALAKHLGDLADFSHPAATLVSVAGLARPEFEIEIEAIVEV